MELRDYLRIIARRLWLFLAVLVVVTLATYIITISLPVTYDASTFINATVKSESQQSSSYYEYDNYYAIQASSLFADTISSWLQDPSNVREIYAKAGIDVKDASIKKLSKMISAKKKQPATVIVNLQARQQDKAEALVDSVIEFVQNRTASWASQGLVKNAQAVTSTPVVIEHKSSVATNTLIGFVAGLILGAALVFFLEYMAGGDKK